MTTMYRIQLDGFRDQGPFTGQQIDDLVKAGKIDPDQDVEKVATGKVIKARVALLSAEANDAPAKAAGPVRALIGAILVVGAIAACGWLVSVDDEKNPVRFKHFIIPGVMFLIGAQSVFSYFTAGRAKTTAAQDQSVG